MSLKLSFCLLFFIMIHKVVLLSTKVVTTSQGPIIGQKVWISNKFSYTAFYGVPYAQVDENNPFEKNSPYPTSTTPFNASDPSIMCPQVVLREGGILQCLRLNIHVPNNRHPKKYLPVFVWFHGGSLAFGSAGEYKATHLVQEDIIVVTANYRLGPYGFICTPDIKNQGLEDMKTALRWIRKEIGKFGGDHNKVTIAGESWGGASVDYLLYEDAYFNQAIIQSGTRFSYAVSSREDTDIIVKLAVYLGHNTSDYRDALKFLSKANPIEVMRAYNAFEYDFSICEKPGDFKLNLSAEYAGRIRNTPIMIGYTSKETFHEIASQPNSYYATPKNNFYNSLGKVFDLKNETLRNLTNTIWKFYLGDKTVTKDAMLNIIDLTSDFKHNYGVHRAENNLLMMQNTRVYRYVYSYIGESPYKNVTGVGAYHTQELPLLFSYGTPLKTEEEFKMRRWLVKLWTNFVKYGEPTPKLGQHGWLPSLPKDLIKRRYLNINVKTEMKDDDYSTYTTTKDYSMPKRMTLWENIWAEYRQYRK